MSLFMMQAELEESRKDIQSLRVRIACQDNEVKQLSSQYRSAQQNYERQVRLQAWSVVCEHQRIMLLLFQETRILLLVCKLSICSYRLWSTLLLSTS